MTNFMRFAVSPAGCWRLQCQVGKDKDQRQAAEQYALHYKNSNNGNIFVEFPIRSNLLIKNTWFPHNRIHLGTWKVSRTDEINQIDHTLVYHFLQY